MPGFQRLRKPEEMRGRRSEGNQTRNGLRLVKLFDPLVTYWSTPKRCFRIFMANYGTLPDPPLSRTAGRVAVGKTTAWVVTCCVAMLALAGWQLAGARSVLIDRVAFACASASSTSLLGN